MSQHKAARPHICIEDRILHTEARRRRANIQAPIFRTADIWFPGSSTSQATADSCGEAASSPTLFRHPAFPLGITHLFSAFICIASVCASSRQKTHRALYSRTLCGCGRIRIRLCLVLWLSVRLHAPWLHEVQWKGWDAGPFYAGPSAKASRTKVWAIKKKERKTSLITFLDHYVFLQ